MSEATGGMEANSDVAVACEDPDYITYLLDPEQEYNCYFVVGNETQNTEKIGVVKKMLLAHSVVLRAELQDSKIAEKSDVLVTDIFPDTFKNLLRYVYGFDKTASLSFDEADNLLYAAEKYMMTKLKNKLATHLMSMLDYNNICSLMNNPACYTILELNSAITEILQTETDEVLASPQFLNLCPDGLLKILEQDTLCAVEIELWRASLTWAKYRTKSEDGQILRKELRSHMQYMRVCSISLEDFCSEVIPTAVLSYDEVRLVCQSRKNKEMLPQLTTVCNVIEERSSPKSNLMTQTLCSSDYGNQSQTSTNLTTLDLALELCYLEFNPQNQSQHVINCTITVTNGSDPLTVVRFNEVVTPYSNFTVPLTVGGKNLKLKPNCSYKLRVVFSCCSHNAYYNYSGQSRICGRHMKIDLDQIGGYCMSHIKTIAYKTISRKKKNN